MTPWIAGVLLFLLWETALARGGVDADNDEVRAHVEKASIPAYKAKILIVEDDLHLHVDLVDKYIELGRKYNMTMASERQPAEAYYAELKEKIAKLSSKVPFEIELETALSHDNREFLWFHPRAAVIPGEEPVILMTLQKHLMRSDHYSGLYSMTRKGLNGGWTSPEPIPELDWVDGGKGVNIAVADVTPGWHEATGKVIAIGAQVRYSADGAQLEDIPRAHQTAYAVYDPKTDAWSRWHVLEMPGDDLFDFARCACAQWLVEEDGSLLLPLYIGRNVKDPKSVTVARCTFDGETIEFLEHGDVLSLNVMRGLCEPSLAFFGGKYYLTLRNDVKGYVTRGDDPLRFEPIQPWRFDDAKELESYNTQQHWVTHENGLFLVYTRRGANNDHIMRHRAPLFIAQVNPESMRLIRETERILVPERGATLGNFGACAVSHKESWVTVSEGVWNEDARKRGAKGALFVARIRNPKSH